MRLYVIAALCVAVMAAAGALYWAGGKDARRERDALQEQLDTAERMRDADPDFGVCGWSDRLRGDC